MNELTANPFKAAGDVAQEKSLGAMQVQSREMAETQAKYIMAQHFPRDQVRNMDKILNAFTRPNLAEKSQYQFARGGQDITGPSIRAAEAIAQQWGNMEFGFRELNRSTGADGVSFSDVEAFAIDLESRNRRNAQFVVRHWRDTKKGGYELKDERDIYELTANQAQRRVRACILAMIPGDVIDAAMEQAEITLRTKADTSPEAMVKMIEAFEPYGVTKAQIEKRIQRRLDSIRPAQVVALKRIYASLRDDMSEAADWFEVNEGAAPAPGPAAACASTPAAKPTYPADAFKRVLPKWVKAIQDKTSTLQDAIHALESKHPLTDEQKKELSDQFQQPTGTGAMTYAQVASALTGAKDLDALNLAADLIRNVVDEQQRSELQDIYDRSIAQLNND